MEKIKNFIGGKFLTPISKKYLENYDPSKAEIYYHHPDSDSVSYTHLKLPKKCSV